MSKYKNNQQASEETLEDAMKIAKATQKPNQTKEQTKLIAQGIQKGISEYKKQHKAKARALDKQKKKLSRDQTTASSVDTEPAEKTQCKTQWLPWILLSVSWLIMAVFALKF